VLDELTQVHLGRVDRRQAVEPDLERACGSLGRMVTAARLRLAWCRFAKFTAARLRLAWFRFAKFTAARLRLAWFSSGMLTAARLAWHRFVKTSHLVDDAACSRVGRRLEKLDGRGIGQELARRDRSGAVLELEGELTSEPTKFELSDEKHLIERVTVSEPVDPGA
jgi:hypothetical protein